MITSTPIDESRAREAYDLHQAVILTRNQVEGRQIRLGVRLAKMQDARLYAVLGCDTWESYLGQPEVSLSERTAYRLTRIARRYRLTATDGSPLVGIDVLEQMGVAKADMVADAVARAGSEDDRAALVADALALSVSDLRRRLRDQGDTFNDEREMWEQVAAQIAARANRLPDHSEQRAALLDEISDLAMKALGQLRTVTAA